MLTKLARMMGEDHQGSIAMLLTIVGAFHPIAAYHRPLSLKQLKDRSSTGCKRDR
jgi:hypothetical protein